MTVQRMEKRYYKIDEISTYLGFSPNTIRKWIRFGKIPHCRLNGGIRFDVREIDRWVDRKKTKGIYV